VVSGDGFASEASAQVTQPFFGVYGALTNGSFSFDALLRRDYYRLSVKPTQPGITVGRRDSVNGTRWSGLVNA
jgi:hypothetical protein